MKRDSIGFTHDEFVAVGTRLTLFLRADPRTPGVVWALRLS